jgi:hypothetical protein
MGRPAWWHHSRLDVRPRPLPALFRHSNYRGLFNRRYVHGYVTGQRYTPPDSTVNPRNGVVSKEIPESSEKDRVSRTIDVAELDKE